MNIGIDARFYRSTTAGLGRYTRGLLHNLSILDKTNKYTIFITPEDDKEYDITAPNFTKVVIKIGHYTLAEQTKFLSILNKYNFDLVHFLNFNHPLFYRRPFITTVHDLTMLLYPVGRSQKSVVRKIAFKKVMVNAVKSATKAIAISNATKDDMVKYLGASANKIEVIYEGYDKIYHNNYSVSTIDRIKEKYHLSKPYILFVSQWRPHKGLPQLIKAFEILKTKYQLPHDLVITGKPNQNFPDIISSIKNSKFSSSIKLPGFVDELDLPLLYAGTDAFIFPSFYEGFGLGPLEAMACGAAVVSSNLSCMPEILGDAAQYFDPHDITQMAEKIASVLTDKKIRSRLKKKSLLQAKKYSWHQMAQVTLALYQKTFDKNHSY